jgi:ubiquinone/menaquinone biosynthesis C-methylase UbiE
LSSQTERNRAYYGTLAAGRADYWRYMPAPRMRVRAILEVLRKTQPRSIADLGCGDGTLLREIAAALPDARLAGVDLSEAQIVENRAKLPQIEWHVADLETTNPIAAQYDAITASEVIEHLERPLDFLRSAHRIAANGALLIVTTQSGAMSATERVVGHLRHFTADELRAMLVEAGWEPVRVWNAGFPFHDLSKRIASRNHEKVMQRFGERGYGPAEKLVARVLTVLFLFNSRRRGAQLFAVARKRA